MGVRDLLFAIATSGVPTSASFAAMPPIVIPSEDATSIRRGICSPMSKRFLPLTRFTRNVYKVDRIDAWAQLVRRCSIIKRYK
jgi:hypothetical protein